jgi:tripartite-type tricarboxylate transporter receptor subunit TctC
LSAFISRRQFALAAAAGCLGVEAFAQSTLPKSLSLVVPNAAGGSNDVMARAVAMRLPAVLGSSVVVDNRAGAGGNVGSAYVAKSAPRDGSTWLVTINSTQTINPSLYKSTGFDPMADFEPVAGIAVVQHVFLVPKTLPVNNLAELIELARREPGKLSYGSAGNGTFSHLLMEMLKMLQGVQITHVPYKGVAPALTDLVAGNLQVLISTIPACLQFIKSGQVKALAVPSLQHDRANAPRRGQGAGLSGDGGLLPGARGFADESRSQRIAGCHPRRAGALGAHHQSLWHESRLSTRHSTRRLQDLCELTS